MLWGVPYKLSGTKVVKSDTGEVVKDHPTREKALAHLRALKANVEESSPAVLGALLEGFDEGRHPRGAHGRWIRELNALDPNSRHFADVGGVHVRRGGTGGRLFVTKRYLGTNRTPHEAHHGSAEEAARYIEQSQRLAGLPTSRRAEILAKSPGAAAGARDRAFDPVTMLGREGKAEAERQLEIWARMASSSRERAAAQVELDRRRGARTPRPRIRETAPEVLGALLEGR